MKSAKTEKEQLAAYFRRYGKISIPDIDYFFTLMQIKEFSKSEFILEAGKTCKHHYFISKGLTRTLYIDHKGSEKITQFAIENWWLTNWDSYKQWKTKNKS
ncbi:hypothetical protein [uncultured Aquimarina sp.]|uniref:hypothetical protein n=1 Tax=uncultured Aquimarina sp. TaxID=575652 RepID=UPI0026111D40|nr:hypothetical protein [uncultured Aquimarina sp.]